MGRKWIDYTTLSQKLYGAVVVLVTLATMTVFVFSIVGQGYGGARISRDTRQKVFELQQQVLDFSSALVKVADELQVLRETLDEAANDPNNLARVDLQADIKQLSLEVKALTDALGSDIERTLAVPLLRKDVQKIEEQLEERTVASSKEIDRIYDQNKWFLGLVATMVVGLLTLAIGNLLQSRKKESDT